MMAHVIAMLFVAALLIVVWRAATNKIPPGAFATITVVLLVIIAVIWNIDHITKFTSRLLSFETNVDKASTDLAEIDIIKDQVKAEGLAIARAAQDFNEKLREENQQIADQKKATEQIEQLAEISKISILATSDDRSAYMKVRQFAFDAKYPYQTMAMEAMTAAARAISTLMLDYAMHWPSGTDPNHLTLEQLRNIYDTQRDSNSRPDERVALVQCLGRQTGVSQKSQLRLLLDMIGSDPSLKVAIYAAREFSRVAGMQNLMFDLQSYDDWWSQHSSQLK